MPQYILREFKVTDARVCVVIKKNPTIFTSLFFRVMFYDETKLIENYSWLCSINRHWKLLNEKLKKIFFNLKKKLFEIFFYRMDNLELSVNFNSLTGLSKEFPKVARDSLTSSVKFTKPKNNLAKTALLRFTAGKKITF